MQVELVMVGTEMLLGEIVDTNAPWIAARLAEIGVDVYFKTTVGDNHVRLAGTIAQAMSRADVVLISGGLGPTQDDITRQVIAAVTGRPLVHLPEAEQHLQAYFQHAGHPMPTSNARQTLFPEGAVPVPNARGTALGILLEHGGKVVIALPGVPAELTAMMEQTVIPYLAARQGARVTRSRVLHFFGLGESAMEELVQDLMSNQNNPTLAPYAGMGESRLRITARAATAAEADALIAPVEQEIRRRGGRYVYGADNTSLEQVVGELLCQRAATVATAESCTGGLIAHRLTNVPGSSDYFVRGWVTYSNQAKMDELGVPEQLLADYGAVSEPVAKAMALGARKAAASTYAVSATGIAGPGGGSAKKPVGLVYIGIAGPHDYVAVEELRLRGHREGIKYRTASSVLNMLRLHMLNEN